ncbi:MAG TPA: hypothetical protein VJA27_00690 [Patescibacteria group bacterium]|nr:hypothetical protein [Patescibacteria group bacterium]
MIFKKLLVLVSIIALLVGAGFLGWWGWKKITTSHQTSNGQQTLSEQEKQKIAERESINKTMETIEKKDADFDGLSNDEEKRLGTNPEVADTDSDGLLDTYEVQKFKTNPRAADTDGDGMTDGNEVGKGLNPLVKNKS